MRIVVLVVLLSACAKDLDELYPFACAEDRTCPEIAIDDPYLPNARLVCNADVGCTSNQCETAESYCDVGDGWRYEYDVGHGPSSDGRSACVRLSSGLTCALLCGPSTYDQDLPCPSGYRCVYPIASRGSCTNRQLAVCVLEELADAQPMCPR